MNTSARIATSILSIVAVIALALLLQAPSASAQMNCYDDGYGNEVCDNNGEPYQLEPFEVTADRDDGPEVDIDYDDIEYEYDFDIEPPTWDICEIIECDTEPTTIDLCYAPGITCDYGDDLGDYGGSGGAASSGSGTDVCPNVSGSQDSVPDGMTKDESGNCVDAEPVCQDPAASNQGSTGQCLYPPVTCQDPAASNQGSALPCQYPPTTCTDPAATNNGSALPCQYPPTTCQDPGATNYGGALPCQYPQLCQDQAATNYGGVAPCQYPPSTCQDSSASNFGSALPCQYPPTTCTDPAATNNGSALPCQYPPSLCGDVSATNFGSALPCQYPPTTCTDPAATNNGSALPCQYPAAQCADGADNDGDGLSDLSDPGCLNSNDDDESNGGGGNGGPGPQGETLSGFTLDGPAKVGIQFLGPLGGESAEAILGINPVGSFASAVVVRPTSIADDLGRGLPASTTAAYSFVGGEYSSAPSETMSYDGSYYRNSIGGIGLPVRVRFSSAVDRAYNVTFEATGGGKSDIHVLRVDPNSLVPIYREI